VKCYVQGYHVYQRIWNPFVGEVAIAVREEHNTYDRYAVAILEEDTCCSVGHLPREIGGLDFSRSSRTTLRLFAGWLCRRGPANL